MKGFCVEQHDDCHLLWLPFSPYLCFTPALFRPFLREKNWTESFEVNPSPFGLIHFSPPSNSLVVEFIAHASPMRGIFPSAEYDRQDSLVFSRMSNPMSVSDKTGDKGGIMVMLTVQ